MNLSDGNTFGNGLLYVGFNQDQGNGGDLVVVHFLVLHAQIGLLTFLFCNLQVVLLAERRMDFGCSIATHLKKKNDKISLKAVCLT